jgi:hypothetical protein
MLRLQRGAKHLHRLGPRAIAELLLGIGDQIGGMPAILDTLAEYERRLSPVKLKAAGGDRFPPRPLMAVPK